MVLNGDLIQLIQTKLENHSEILVGLKENGNQGLRAVNFCIRPTEIPEEERITLITPRNVPYNITGEEKVAYPRKWRALCDLAQGEGFKDPFEYLKLEQIDDYSINLPTATVILSGFCKYLEAFQGAGLPITHVGRTLEGAPKPLNKRVLDKFTGLTKSFYPGHTVGDVEPTFF
ncbi:hypothetical protein HOC80_01045 [archaeon]|jgi:hypothetical protein|nr:hypothetical protein [archaeon]MBT4416669.1 hypothetical protein [archaeon]